MRLRACTVLVALSCAACSEYRLGGVLPDTDAVDGPDPVDTDLAGPRSPWDDLDPGDAPQDVFVVAFHDASGREGEADGWGLWCLPEAVSPFTWLPPVRYALVDVRGRVLDEFYAPFEESPRFDAFARLSATPDGRVLVTSRAEGEDAAAQRTWSADLESGDVREVLVHREWSGARAVSFLGETVDLGAPFAELYTTLDPLDPTALWVVRHLAGSTAPPPLDEPFLWRLRLDAPAAAPEGWTIRDLAPAGLEDADAVRLTARSLAAVAESGRTLLVLDVSAEGGAAHPDGEPGSQWLTLVFDPATTTHPWVFDREVAHAETYDPGLFVGDGAGHGRLLFEESALDDVLAPTDFQVFTPGAEALPVAAEDLRCNAPLALLDGASPTFAWSGHPDHADGHFGERVVFSHRGADVWRWDVLQDGLNELPFEVRALAWAGVP